MTPKLTPSPLTRLWRRYCRIGTYLLLLSPVALFPALSPLAIPMAVCGGLTGNAWIGAVTGCIWDCSADCPFGLHGLVLWLIAYIPRHRAIPTLLGAEWLTAVATAGVFSAESLWNLCRGTAFRPAVTPLLLALLTLPLLYPLFRHVEYRLQRREHL